MTVGEEMFCPVTGLFHFTSPFAKERPTRFDFVGTSTMSPLIAQLEATSSSMDFVQSALPLETSMQ
ncbi:MAG: hypothetical protein BWX90_01072 [bacterium ADurb.Bin132]|nr:MAG: hypothetical protein BWX90_01072 [bacterium ADurb.Bin132]